jgi:hypothetical protein
MRADIGLSVKRSSGALTRGSVNAVLILKSIQIISEVLKGHVKHINSNKSTPWKLIKDVCEQDPQSMGLPTTP